MKAADKALRITSALFLATALIACEKQGPGGSDPSSKTDTATPAKKTKDFPVFTLAWSEYPSWSVFDVASSQGFINGAKGKYGEFEKQYEVDVVLKEAEYDACITLYGTGQVDAVAITNMDILKPSLSRKAVAIIPTSTSYGADAVLVDKSIKNVDALKTQETRGLDLSVSEYMFARNIELLGKNPKDFKFTSMDPGAAALAMQQGDKKTKSIAVWNPFVMQTLSRRDDVRVLFDSSTIPGEIVDLIVMGDDSLNKEGGKQFARALAAAFYAVNANIKDPNKRSDTLKAVGEKFANLSATEMEKIVQQTRFYASAEAGTALFSGGPVLAGVSEKKLEELMPKVLKFSLDYGIVEKAPKVAFGSDVNADLRFDPSYLVPPSK